MLEVAYKQDNHILLIRLIFAFFVISLFFFFNIDIITVLCANHSEKEDKPIAVMIGNSPKERAIQKGLASANVVYEIEVEFPFTRYMAIFWEDRETVVGPIRSSRYYFSRLCAEWNAIFAHCGGQHLKNSNILNIDELNLPFPFWRDKEIGGWINLFTSTLKLRQEAKKQNYSAGNHIKHPLLNFGEPSTNNTEQIRKITIKYHTDYIVSYEYHQTEHQYYRTINQKPHIDQASMKQIKVSNIIIQYVPIEKIGGDEEGRIQVELVGEGMGRIFYGGIVQPLKWIKKSKDEQTLFLNQEGSPITYHQGATWIHLLSPESEYWMK